MNELDNFAHLTTFEGLPVADFDPAKGLENAATHAYRVSVNWDDSPMEEVCQKKLEALLASEHLDQLQGLIIGNWCETGTSPKALLDMLLAAAPRLTALRAVFVGDIEQEESEVSWIEQGDHGPLISALPAIETYVVRGGNGARFTDARSGSLRKLIVQSGGLSSATIETILKAKLPAVRHLELWLGEDNYGFDGSVDTVRPLIDGSAYPALTYLGLRNSEIVDGIAAALTGSPRFGRLSTLDLSKGNLSDEGAKALLANPELASLERLDLHHHYMTDEVMKAFAALDLEVDVDEQEEAEEDDDEVYRYIAVSE